jgi:S1-C subfamily serine protease
VEDDRDVVSALDKHDPGDEVTVRYVRDGCEDHVRVRLGEIE